MFYYHECSVSHLYAGICGKKQAILSQSQQYFRVQLRPVTSAAALSRQIYLFTLLWPASADILSAG